MFDFFNNCVIDPSEYSRGLQVGTNKSSKAENICYNEVSKLAKGELGVFRWSIYDSKLAKSLFWDFIKKHQTELRFVGYSHVKTLMRVIFYQITDQRKFQ